MQLKTTETTYTMTKAELAVHFAQELKVSPTQITIKENMGEVGDDRFGPTTKVFMGLTIVVKSQNLVKD